jgi:3-phosphoshikimate 1-carboxyvinyltransferase
LLANTNVNSILTVSPASGLKGEVQLPGDKSIAHRAAIFAALAKGESYFHNFPDAQDPLTTLACLGDLGIAYEFTRKSVLIYGKGRFGLKESTSSLDAGNSGTTMRLFAGFLSGQSFDSKLIGDDSLSKRPMRRIIRPLSQMGAKISGTRLGTAPLTIKSIRKPLRSIVYELPVPSAQVKSAILLAGLFAEGTTTVIERFRTRDHTERMLGLRVSREDGRTRISVSADLTISRFRMTIPGDPSSAAFFIVAALIIPESDIIIRNISLNPTRIAYLSVLKKMGGNIEIIKREQNEGEETGDVRVRSSKLSGYILEGADIPLVIDEIPILAVAGACSNGIFRVRNAEELRSKESDRISSVITNLRAMGIKAEEYPDGFSVSGGKLVGGAALDSYGDHRLSMTSIVAGLAADRESTVANYEAATVSFPNFLDMINTLRTS